MAVWTILLFFLCEYKSWIIYHYERIVHYLRRNWTLIHMKYPTVISYEMSYESIHREIVKWYFIGNFERNFIWNVVRNYSLNSMNKVSCGTSYEISYNAMKFYS